MKLWDAKNLAAPLTTIEIDQAAGVMMPFYDEDVKMLYLTGKGDGNVRYYELTDEAPFLFALAEHRTNVSTKGADFLPKRALAPLRCEVARMLKLTSDSMEPISFIVPRKSESFQEDIFPDTYAGVPSHSAESFFSGNDAAPKKVSMDPAKGGAMSAAPAVVRAAGPAPAAGGSGSAASPSPVATPKSTASSGSGAVAGSGSTSGPSSADLDAAVKRAKVAEDKARSLEAQVSELKVCDATAVMSRNALLAANGVPVCCARRERVIFRVVRRFARRLHSWFRGCFFFLSL
jgi:coronin-1B/1C/6